MGYRNWFRHESISIRSMSYLGNEERKKNISKNAINYPEIWMDFEYLNNFNLKIIQNSFDDLMMIRINADDSFDWESKRGDICHFTGNFLCARFSDQNFLSMNFSIKNYLPRDEDKIISGYFGLVAICVTHPL